MKHIRDMTQEERRAYRNFAQDIAENCLTVAKETGPEEKLALLCMFIKAHGRPIRNLIVEYQIEPDTFLEDAIVQTLQFTENAGWLVSNERIKMTDASKTKVLRTCEVNMRALRHPTFRSFLTETFLALFSAAAARGFDS